jgi:hypothetical protein
MNQPRMPSPAILVAMLALVAAIAGPAVAGQDASTSAITQKKIKQIVTKQIKKLAPGLSVASADTLDNLNSTDFRRSNEVIGANDLGTITQRSTLSADIAPGAQGSAAAQCNAGEQFLSGGNDVAASMGGDVDVSVVASRRESPNGWRVFVENEGTGNAVVNTHVYCLEP